MTTIKLLEPAFGFCEKSEPVLKSSNLDSEAKFLQLGARINELPGARVSHSSATSKSNNPSHKKPKPSAWSQAAYGVKWLPVSMVFQAASVGIGILKGWTHWDTVRNMYNPPTCPIPIPTYDDKGGIKNVIYDLDVVYNHPGNSEAVKESIKNAVKTAKMANYRLLTQTVATEEFLFRTLLQDIFLKKVPKWIFEKIAPNKVHWVDSKIAKVARISLSAAAFAAYHRGNQVALGLSDSQMNMQLCNTFGLGIATGILQEKTGNTWASIGLHLSHNLLAGFLVLRKCY